MIKQSTFTKGWIISLIVVVILITGASLFAYWPIVVNPPEDKKEDTTIKFGTAGAVTTIINLADIEGENGKALVPVGKVSNPNRQTDVLYFDLYLCWDEKLDSKGTTGDVPFIGDLVIIGSATTTIESLRSLVNIEMVNEDNILVESYLVELGREIKVKIKITLTIPPTEEIYHEIKGQEFQVLLTIDVYNPREK